MPGVDLFGNFKTILVMKTMAYFAGQTAEFEEKQADMLIHTGYAEPYKNDEAGDDSDLPADIPARNVLVNLGLTMAELKSIADLTQLTGIGKATAAAIKKYLEQG